MMKNFDYIFILLLTGSSLQRFQIANFNLNHLVIWVLLFVLSIALFKMFKNKLLIATMVFFMIFFRVLALVRIEFYLFYDIINNLLFFLAGLFVFTFRERIFFKQLLFIACICTPIMVLQLAGIPWVHYHTYGQEIALSNGFIDTFFQSDPLISTTISHFQYRPSAILYSNQPLDLFLVFIAGYFLFHIRRLKWFHYTLISCALVLSTSYFVYFSYILLMIAFLCIKNKYYKKRKMKVLTAICFALLSFSIIFPGINDMLWDKYDIMNKISVRLMDFQLAGINVFELPLVSDMQSILLETKSAQLQAFYKEVVEPGDYNTFSIVSYFYKNLLMGIIIFSFFTFVIMKIIKTNNSLKYAKLSTLYCLISFSIINPHIDTSMFCFLLAFPATTIFPDFYIKYGKIHKAQYNILETG
jgi:hypothetical protein